MQERGTISFKSDDSKMDDSQENEVVEQTDKDEYESSSEEEFEFESCFAICKGSNPSIA